MLMFTVALFIIAKLPKSYNWQIQCEIFNRTLEKKKDIRGHTIKIQIILFFS